MTDELKGKVAAITGAASGIGLECARSLLAAGCRVVLIDRAEDRLNAICQELGPDAIPLVVDLMDGPAVDGMLDRIVEKTGHLDIFHANAGAYVGGSVVDGNPDQWDKVLNLNINAAFRSIRAVLPHMVERKTGDIITLAVFGALSLYIFSMASLFALRRNEPELPRPYLAPAYPLLPAVALVLAIGCLGAVTYYNRAMFGVFVAIMLGSYLLFRIVGPQSREDGAV